MRHGSEDDYENAPVEQLCAADDEPLGESAGAGDMNPHASILDSGDGEAQSVLTVTDLILGCTTPGWHASSVVYL